jgi:DNA-binding transcriptional LysR family regulator
MGLFLHFSCTPTPLPVIFAVRATTSRGHYAYYGIAGNIQHILENGGVGYFPRRLVRPHLESGRLTALAGAPEFALPAYVVYPTDSDPALFGLALDGI